MALLPRLSRLSCIVPALAGAPALAENFADYSGAALYGRFCASCHGPEGRGDGPVADAMAVMVPDLTRLADRRGGRLDAERLAEIIDGRAVVVAHGTRYMPVWGYEFWVESGADAGAEAEVRTILLRLLDHLASLQR